MRLSRPIAALLLAVAAAPAIALDTFGPPFGANKYSTSLTTVDGSPDVDDYVATLLAGETLDVGVAANKGSAALLQLSLVDPDGALTDLAAPAVKEKAGGKSVTLKRFPITKSGRWGVRVSGRSGTEGAYTITFKVTPPKTRAVANLHLGGTDPLFTDLSIDALDGALLDLTVKWSKKLSAVHVGTVKDPAGAEVAATPVESAKGTTTLKRVVLHTGDGPYSVRLFIDAGEATYSVSSRVTPQGRPSGKKTVALPIEEPFLDPVSSPVRGAADHLVRLTGRGFIADPPPTVFFGKSAGVGVIVTDAGRALTVVAPSLPDGSTVTVSVVAKDGQAAVRDAYFYFVPMPTITDLVDASNVPVRGGIGSGGTALRLLGTHFETGQTVSFGNRPVTGATVVSATRLDIVTPPSPNGFVDVTLRDPFGRLVFAGFQFEYKLPPKFSTPAYDPHYGPAGGGGTVSVLGLGFEQNDELRIDGTLVESNYVTGAKRTFVLPSLSLGFHTVTLTDRFGLVGTAPDFELRSPPTINSVQAIGGPRLSPTDIAGGGGTVIQVSGTGFDVDHAARLAGNAGTVTSASATQITFTSPPAPLGAVSVTVTDHAGQTVTAVNALRCVGYEDETRNRQPGRSAADDFSALRGVVDDLDDDGKKDDLVLVSDKISPGSRQVLTRLLLGNGSSLEDWTNSNFPAARADPQRVDSYAAQAVAVGDIDSGNGRDIVIAGDPTGLTSTYVYNYYEARVFSNGGNGSFSFSYGSPPVRYASVYCSDGAGGSYQVLRPGVYSFINYSYTDPINGSRATAVAVGDLDNDGASDIVMATDNYRLARVYIAPANVSFTPFAYVDSGAASHYSSAPTTYYAPALRVFFNSGYGNFYDLTFPRIPLCGTSATTAVPGFHGRDVKIGDIDGDALQSPDIVVTWDDPLTVSPLGLSQLTDSERVATRILINNGAGFFADQTSTWLPAGSSPEFWQGSRVELADIDRDGDKDIVLLAAQSTDAYLGTPSYGSSALRILRNDGLGVGFVDVTATMLPTVPLAGTKNDNLRGTALTVGDVNGDGRVDILVGTTEALLTSTNSPGRRTRLLRATAFGTFVDASGFLPVTTAHTGEADDLLLGDVAGNLDPSLVLVTSTPPAVNASGEFLRVFDWKR